MTDHGTNLRRLMARFGLTLEELIERTGLHERTVRSAVAGRHKPHARTLHRLAEGLGVPADELFQDPSLLAHRTFDRQTNPEVEEVIASDPELFAGWTETSFDELYSRFGEGGALTPEGARTVVQTMNEHREVQRKVALLLESGESDVLKGVVELLYQRIQVPTLPRKAK
jgi:transcriptional regulator with XRE-family HTH domain